MCPLADMEHRGRDQDVEACENYAHDLNQTREPVRTDIRAHRPRETKKEMYGDFDLCRINRGAATGPSNGSRRNG